MSPQTMRSIVQYLKGLDLPASKQDIVQCAIGNRAPDDVVAVLQRIHQKQYDQMDDVWRELGRQL